MANPEWGTKRQCPKCGTRFYDLGNNDPIVCIDCGNKFKPEVILKSKMTPMDMTSEKKEPKDSEDGDDILDDDLLDEKDLLEDGSDDVGIEADDNTVVLSDDDTNVSDVVVKATPNNTDE